MAKIDTEGYVILNGLQPAVSFPSLKLKLRPAHWFEFDMTGLQYINPYENQRGFCHICLYQACKHQSDKASPLLKDIDFLLWEIKSHV